MAVFCPIASLLGPLLGVVALARIRRRPHLRGTKVAVTGIVIGLLATGGWAATARWWHVNARLPMLEGPVAALKKGLAGDVGGFTRGFVAHDAAGDQAEAAAFLNEVAGRFGRLRGSTQRVGDQASAPAANPRRPRIAYTFEFESGPVEAEAQFVIWDEGTGLVFKFAWLALRDRERGDLAFPKSAGGPLEYDPVSQPEQPR
jgi:hypothetical protein